MSNIVGELIEDVAFRLGDIKARDPIFPPHMILRQMRRVYQSLNEEYKAVRRMWNIDFSSPGANDSVDDMYAALPSDFIAAYKFDEDSYWTYLPPHVWNTNKKWKFTIELGRLYLTGVDSSTTLDVYYYSRGYTLVNVADADVGTGEVNTPEWPDYLYGALVHGTALRMSANYPLREVDFMEFKDYKSKLSREARLKQFVTPQVAGPRNRETIYDTTLYSDYELGS